MYSVLLIILLTEYYYNVRMSGPGRQGAHCKAQYDKYDQLADVPM